MDRRTALKSALTVGGCILLPSGVAAIIGRNSTRSQSESLGFDGRIMGTSYSVLLAPNVDAQNQQPSVQNQFKLKALASQVHAQLQSVDASMSTWKPDSELSRFNRYVGTDWQAFSSPTVGVIAQALETSRQSLGAFDPTINPLINLWGFGANFTSHSTSYQIKKPSTQAIQSTLKNIGYAALEINTKDSLVRKLKPQLQIDLSGIAKGYAVDKIADVLDKNGMNNYLIEVGGELRAKGRKTVDSPWRVAIEKPRVDSRDAFRVIALADMSVATSGDYRNYYMHEGMRYSHAIDPRYGAPVQHDLISVTVVSNTTIQADALSTALMIMGPGQALSYANRHNIAAHFIYETANGVVEHQSAAFKHHIG